MTQILEEVTKEAIINFQEKAKANQIIIIKFTATWCAPCQKIKSECYEWFAKLPKNIICADIDIDEHIDLYVALKSKKMVRGIPTIFVYKREIYMKSDPSHIFIPQASIAGTNEKEIQGVINMIK